MPQPGVAAQTYQEHLEEWVLCEDLGFDGALVNEHHFTYFNVNHSYRTGRRPAEIDLSPGAGGAYGLGCAVGPRVEPGRHG